MKIAGAEVGEIPEAPEAKIKDLMDLPLARKQGLIPPAGYRFQLGPFVFEVAVTNPSQLRFSARMVDVVVEKERPLIIRPEVKIV
jgi:hypothetical protein